MVPLHRQLTNSAQFVSPTVTKLNRVDTRATLLSSFFAEFVLVAGECIASVTPSSVLYRTGLALKLWPDQTRST